MEFESQIRSSRETVMLFVSPFVLAIGLFGNFAILILARRLIEHFRAFVSFFAATTVADTIILLFTLLPRWIAALTGLRIKDEKDLACKFSTWIYHASTMTSSCCLAAMTAQRAVGVVWPYSAKAASTNRVASGVITAVVVSSLILHSHVLVDQAQDFTGCFLSSEIYFRDTFWGNVWSLTNFAFAFLLPFFVIITSDIILLLHRQGPLRSVNLKRKRISKIRLQFVVLEALQRLRAAKQKDKPRKTRCQILLSLCRAHSVTWMIVTMSLVFLFLVGPWFLAEALVTSAAIPYNSISSDGRLVMEQLKLSKAAINFYLYCFTGGRFRTETYRFFQRLFPFCAQPTRPETGSSDYLNVRRPAHSIISRWKHTADSALTTSVLSDSQIKEIPEEPTPAMFSVRQSTSVAITPSSSGSSPTDPAGLPLHRFDVHESTALNNASELLDVRQSETIDMSSSLLDVHHPTANKTPSSLLEVHQSPATDKSSGFLEIHYSAALDEPPGLPGASESTSVDTLSALPLETSGSTDVDPPSALPTAPRTASKTSAASCGLHGVENIFLLTVMKLG